MPASEALKIEVLSTNRQEPGDGGGRDLTSEGKSIDPWRGLVCGHQLPHRLVLLRADPSHPAKMGGIAEGSVLLPVLDDSLRQTRTNAWKPLQLHGRGPIQVERCAGSRQFQGGDRGGWSLLGRESGGLGLDRFRLGVLKGFNPLDPVRVTAGHPLDAEPEKEARRQADEEPELSATIRWPHVLKGRESPGSGWPPLPDSPTPPDETPR